MNILVTGGFGFVGGHLIDQLTTQYLDARVHVVDNLSTNPIPLKQLLSELGPRKNLTYDICSVKEFVLKKDNVRWDYIYHLASVVGPAGVLVHAGNIAWMIIEDTKLLIELALKSNARFLDVSTSEVYGGGKDGLCSETYNKVIQPETSARLEYAVGKLASETMLINKGKVSDLDAKIVRPFNISGPRQSGVGGFVLPRFIGFAMDNVALTVFDDGSGVRAFTHVRDIASGIIRGMEQGCKGEVYNLGNPMNKITINQLADMVITITKSKSQKIYVDPKTIYGPLYEGANDKYPDAKKAMTKLDWQPKYSIEEIIEETYQYMRGLTEHDRHILTGYKSEKRVRNV